jgi:hypothetical protein
MDLLGMFKQRSSDEWGRETKEEVTDWTHSLSPESMALLRKILESAYGHREAYFRATDIKNAQLWSALIEMQRQIDRLKEQVDRLTPKETYRKFQLGAPDESKVLDRIRAMMQKGPEDSREARNALISSLMRF